jgi:transcriptional regulator with XRE-family HTH domain
MNRGLSGRRRARHQALKHLGAALRRRREQLGLSLEAVAQQCAINRAALSKLELGQNPNPTFETLWRYADALGQQVRCELVESSGLAQGAKVAPGTIPPGD